MPSLISRTVSEHTEGTISGNSDLLYNFLYSMRVNLGSPEMVLDYIKAIKIANGLAVDEKSVFQDDISLILNYFKTENNTAGLLLSIIKAYPSADRENIINLLEKIDSMDSTSDILHKKNIDRVELAEPVPNSKTVLINNSKFIGFSSGSYLSGSPISADVNQLLSDEFLTSFPHIESLSEFFILEKEITRGDYTLFLEENPFWNLKNINTLIDNKLVNNDYLKFQDFSDTGKPISNVSWYAAIAYCEWLETKIPLSMPNYRIKLPTEAQWEAAARSNANVNSKNIFLESAESNAKSTDFTRMGETGLYDIMGNLWEWCDNWYFPTDTVNGTFGMIGNIFTGVEKTVRGGSWANSKDEIQVITRGSQNPAWCTPFLGFRPVLVRQ